MENQALRITRHLGTVPAVFPYNVRMCDIERLNHSFGLSGQICFTRSTGNLIMAEIRNRFATASLTLQGAQLLSWTPIGSEPVLWVSPEAAFREGKAIRGGIPVCWPWFGPHTTDAGLPSHGFARTQPWELVSTRSSPEGKTELLLQLLHSPSSRAYWPHQTPLQLHLIVGETLTMELITRNLTPHSVTIGSALHAYFTVGDIRRISVQGLAGRPYLDLVEQGIRKRQDGPVRVAGETDRIYLDTTDDCVIEDPVLDRAIVISKRGSRSTIVWNPWVDKSARLGDMGPERYLGMICVESANAADDQVTIEPGAEHRLEVGYAVQRRA